MNKTTEEAVSGDSMNESDRSFPQKSVSFTLIERSSAL